jgi:isoquinoline 1-oxidoreductase subunit alpha
LAALHDFEHLIGVRNRVKLFVLFLELFRVCALVPHAALVGGCRGWRGLVGGRQRIRCRRVGHRLIVVGCDGAIVQYVRHGLRETERQRQLQSTAMKLQINRQTYAVDPQWQGETLLSVLREHLGLTGSKFGCGVGLCGACTVLLDGQALRSCQLQVSDSCAREITTIEGLADSARGDALHPVQQAWLHEAAPQCGYCQAGQIMSTVALLRVVPEPTDAQINEALAGNLCRCGTQQRIRIAVHRVVNSSAGAPR